jgi:opacity protein-like surface antigen
MRFLLGLAFFALLASAAAAAEAVPNLVRVTFCTS